MARLRRIALFAEPSPLFINVLMGLKAGFEALGVEAHAGWPPLSGRNLPAFLANFQPDAILEINRSLGHIKDHELAIPHVCWLQDFQYLGQRLLDDLGGSQLVYFMNPPDMFGYDPSGLNAWGYLWPGVNPALMGPAPQQPDFTWDLSFVGHIYPPLPAPVAAAPLVVHGTECGTLADAAAFFDASDFTESAFSVPALFDIFSGYFTRFGVTVDLRDLDERKLYLFHEVLLRTKGRRHIADQMLRVSRKLRFFGSSGWSQWPAFATHYGGDLADPPALQGVYRASALNVHCSIWPFHFRPLDAMACGGAVMINTVKHPDTDRLFHSQFTPDEDFISYELDEFPDVARRALADRAWTDRVRANAARRIREGHEYRHRAVQILRDLDAL